ncbi:MAG: hypothetical protein CL670_11320 [Balneola sp.]|jgi:hypothetical protein|nr:hypothetical protein [Balneola sp.]MBE79736.1 hypothetical protein [Balneola sp.]|tara:strand:+ start:30159 stop:31667 length:1509 start_codon:yes stop_codon:yes gene_type:complete
MRQALIILLFLCLSVTSVSAQAVLTPRNLALGGGGSTYITDYNANFYNPANLMIRDRQGDFSIGVGIAGFYFNSFQNFDDPNQQFENALDHTGVYSRNISSQFGIDRDEILDDNYPANNTLSDNTTRYDVTLLGMKWKKENRSFSIALRTRTSSNYKVGKGWYTGTFEQNQDDDLVLDRSLIHRYQSLHEISFGYAESFQFLTGLTPRLDNFVIGIAPKVVMGGSYQSAVWENVYTQQGNTTTRVESFSYDATGEFGTATDAFLNGSSVENANEQAFNSTPFSIAGIGAGLDIGVTYLITFGSDLSAIRPNQQPTERSLRLSFSMTDIGFISYQDEGISVTATQDTMASVTAPNSVIDEIFIGAKGQYLDFIDQYGEENPFALTSSESGGFSTLLPMAMHGGALFEINRLKLMGDVSIGLTNNAFNSTKLISSLGMEIRPLKFLPLRGGISFKGQRPNFVSVGTAIETKKWDFSLAAVLTPNSFTNKPTVTGVSVATLQFHF